MNYFSENHIFSSHEEIKFKKSFSERFHELLTTGKLPIETFLNMFAPHRVSMWKDILRKLKFSYDGNVIADVRLPTYVGGYYDLKDTIAINAFYLLYASEVEIASILAHEGIHAGVYTDGVNVEDESVTETLARKKINDVYSDQGFPAYEDLVSQVKEFFGDYSFEEMVELIENGDEETFDNFLELIVINPLCESEDPRDLEWSSIDKKLKKQWKFVKQMFPRMINSIQERNVNPHEEATMDVQQYKLEGLLAKAAEKITNDYAKLADIIIASTKHVHTLVTSQTIYDVLRDEGYSYLLDFAADKMNNFVHTFVQMFNVAQLQNNKVDADTLFRSFQKEFIV